MPSIMGADCSKERGAVAVTTKNGSDGTAAGKRKATSGAGGGGSDPDRRRGDGQRAVPTKKKKDPPPPTTQQNPPTSPRTRNNIPQGIRASNYNFAHERARSTIEDASERSTSDRPIGVVGLRNLGNTCYMNSSLQCLAMTIPLADYFLGDAHRGEINASNPLGSKGKLVQAFAKHIRNVWIDAPASRVLRPASFKSALENFAYQFEGTRQHDAQEFLSILLDGIHEDLNRVKKKPYIEYKDCDGTNDAKDAVDAWKNYLQRDKSVVVDIFQGQLRNCLRCLHCRHQNIRFEPIMYLSVPIDSSCKTLDDCLRLFLREERLTGENRWYCPKCKTHRDSTKKFDIWVLPPILIVHFKRFRMNEYGQVASKNNQPIKFPLEDWMVGSYIKNKDCFAPRYSLYAVANHMGNMGQGHYWAYGLHRLDEQWYEFNDSTTKPMDQSEIQRNSSNAYLLFYNRVNEDETSLRGSHGTFDRSAPMIRRQSESRPDLWPHLQVVENRYRSFSRSSQRSLLEHSMSFPQSPVATKGRLPSHSEVLQEDQLSDGPILPDLDNGSEKDFSSPRDETLDEEKQD